MLAASIRIASAAVSPVAGLAIELGYTTGGVALAPARTANDALTGVTVVRAACDVVTAASAAVHNALIRSLVDATGTVAIEAIVQTLGHGGRASPAQDSNKS